MTDEPFRILIVVNKTWECDPLISVLLSKDGPPAGTFAKLVRGVDSAGAPPATDPTTGTLPAPPPEAEGLPMRGALPPRPRLSFDVTTSQGASAQVEVWCVEDWMRPQRHTTNGLVAVSGSSSHEKFTVALPVIRARAFQGRGCGLVIAFGTAGIPTAQSLNGCVTIGSRIYLNDPWDDAPESEIKAQESASGPMLREPLRGWLRKRLDCPCLSDSLFTTGISSESRHAAEARLLETPINPARPPRILAGHGFAALGTINIVNYDDYIWADEETLQRFAQQVKQHEIGSAETTHGLIRLAWHDAPFLFVSALTDRVPYFNVEVTPRKYSQNFAAAHNAGVALAHLLPELVRLAKQQKNGLFSTKSETIACEQGPLPKPTWPSVREAIDCPVYSIGETFLDCPWASIARELAGVSELSAAEAALRNRAPEIVHAIERDSKLSGCLESWGECLNFDELALAPIVSPTILEAISALAGQPGQSPRWHAGLTHTYGYLFSLLRTSFGYKRKRWVSPDLAFAFGLPPGTLGPTPPEGSLLANVTWLLGQVAFADDPKSLARLEPLRKSMPSELQKLSLLVLPRQQLRETFSRGNEHPVCECRTDLVALPRPGADSHLLVYSIRTGEAGGARLITGFPVGEGMVRTLVANAQEDGAREVRSRYNAFVPGLTTLGTWQVTSS